MNYQEILAPVDDYKNHLKEAHAQNTIEAFEALLKRSGVDEQANVAQVKKVRALESAVNSLKTKLGFFSFLRGTAIVAVVISSIALAAHFLTLFQIISLFLVSGTWLIRFAVTDAVSLVLLILWLHPRVKFLRNELATNQEKLDAALAEAWQQMQPLNRLLQWDTIAGVVMKTMPIVQILFPGADGSAGGTLRFAGNRFSHPVGAVLPEWSFEWQSAHAGGDAQSGVG